MSPVAAPPAPSVTFRLAGPRDAPALADFMSRNFLAAYGHCSTPENIAAAIAEHYGLAAQLRQISDPNRANLLAETAAGVLAGHAQLHFDGETPDAVTLRPAADVARFYVDVAFHGQGVAQAMMAEVERIAAARGMRALWLSVWQEQPQAVRFYEKAGFLKAGTLVFVVGDDPKDDWLMVKRLPAPESPATAC
jgi:ribosomal protein S18 acetylase RimI-like enzyme